MPSSFRCALLQLLAIAFVEGQERELFGHGCFAPWTQVLMADGSEQAISEIKAGDVVLSWNSETGSQADARVQRVDAVPVAGRRLFELRIWPALGDELLLQRVLQPVSSFVLTEDHPVYSARALGAVSMSPSMTRGNYQMPVAQMNETEILITSEGFTVMADAQAWTQPLEQVITLELEGHHWFYVEGVRVHNKGFGHAGHSFHGHSTRLAHHSATHFFSHGAEIMRGPGAIAFAMQIISGNRRRRSGTWYSIDGDHCVMNSTYLDNETIDNSIHSARLLGDDAHPHLEAESDSVGSNVTKINIDDLESLCSRTMKDDLDGNCTRCNECTTYKCIKGLPGCILFLTSLYKECKVISQGPSEDWAQIKQIFVILFVFAILVALSLAAIRSVGQSAAGVESQPIGHGVE